MTSDDARYPTGSRRIEVNPGELFMVAPRTILVHEYESVLMLVSKIGTTDNDRIAYAFTFTGKANNADDVEAATVLMSPEDAFELASDILDGITLLTSKEDET